MMKKELTRRSFLKLAGVGALAVAMSGSLTGCDVIDNLKDMDSVSAAIGDVKFMMSASACRWPRKRCDLPADLRDSE